MYHVGMYQTLVSMHAPILPTAHACISYMLPGTPAGVSGSESQAVTSTASKKAICVNTYTYPIHGCLCDSESVLNDEI